MTKGLNSPFLENRYSGNDNASWVSKTGLNALNCSVANLPNKRIKSNVEEKRDYEQGPTHGVETAMRFGGNVKMTIASSTPDLYDQL